MQDPRINLSRGRTEAEINQPRYQANYKLHKIHIEHSTSFNIEHDIIQYTIINVNHNYLLPLDLFINYSHSFKIFD